MVFSANCVALLQGTLDDGGRHCSWGLWSNVVPVCLSIGANVPISDGSPGSVEKAKRKFRNMIANDLKGRFGEGFSTPARPPDRRNLREYAFGTDLVCIRRGKEESKSGY